MAKGMTVSEVRSQFKAVKEQLSPEALGKLIAKQALAMASRVEDGHRQQLGTTFPRTQIVDGVIGGRLEAGRQVIVFRWSVQPFIVRWIIDELRRRSPRLTGKYSQSHRLLINGNEVDPADFSQFRPDDEVAIVSLLPYARKIERGQSRQAPKGVYELAAMAARVKFGAGSAAPFAIDFTYREYLGYEVGKPKRKSKSAEASRRRFPTITIRPRIF